MHRDIHRNSTVCPQIRGINPQLRFRIFSRANEAFMIWAYCSRRQASSLETKNEKNHQVPAHIVFDLFWIARSVGRMQFDECFKTRCHRRDRPAHLQPSTERLFAEHGAPPALQRRHLGFAHMVYLAFPSSPGPATKPQQAGTSGRPGRALIPGTTACTGRRLA